MPRTTDVRSVPLRIFNLYLYSLGGWAIALLGLYVLGRVGVALTLCFPLSIWLAGLTVYWWRWCRRSYGEGELERLEVDAGVRTVGRILASGGLIPGIIYLSYDPLSPAGWGAFLGIVVLWSVVYVAVSRTSRVSNGAVHTLALFAAWILLPLNATGTVTLASIWGVFDSVLHLAPVEGLPGHDTVHDHLHPEDEEAHEGHEH